MREHTAGLALDGADKGICQESSPARRAVLNGARGDAEPGGHAANTDPVEALLGDDRDGGVSGHAHGR